MKLIIERYNNLAGTSLPLLGNAHGLSTVAHILCEVVFYCRIVMFFNKLLLEIMKKFSRTLCEQDIVSTGDVILQATAVCMYVCMYLCMYVCVCVCIYIYIYIVCSSVIRVWI